MDRVESFRDSVQLLSSAYVFTISSLNIHQDISHVFLISENFDILCVYTLKHSLIQFAI